ncbi:MAG: adenylate/guanylate cyclase domain-containing protein [Chlamydiia bacterium]
MRLRVKILSLVSLLSVVGYVVFILIQQFTISSKLRAAEVHIQEEMIAQNEQKRISLERFLRSVLADTQVRTNMLLMKIDRYAFMKEQFLPTPESYEKGTWFESASTLLLNPWLELIQVENGDKITSMYSIAPPYVNGFWHFTGIEGVELFAKYDAQGGLVGPYIGIPFWMGENVDYSKSGIKDLEKKPEGFEFWLLFNPTDILKLDITKLQATVTANPIKPLQINVWIKNDQVYQTICNTLIENMKIIHARLQTPEAASLYKILESSEANAWMNQKLLPLQSQITEGETVYEKLERISQTSLDNKEIIPIRYEEMSRRWDEMRFIWEFSTVFLSGIFGNDMNAPSAPDGYARSIKGEPKGLGFLMEELYLDKPFKLFDPTGISQGFDNDIEKLNAGIGVIYHPDSQRIYIGNRLHLNYQDPTTNNNRAGSITVGVDASSVVQQIAVATQESTFLIVDGKVLMAYRPDGSTENEIQLNPQIITRMQKYQHGLIMDALGHEYIFFRIQPYEEMDLELFVFKLRSSELNLLQSLAAQIKDLLRSLTFEMFVFAVVLSGTLVLLLWYLLRSMLKPLSTLADAVEKVGRGDIDEDLLKNDFKGQADELVTLYTNFEAMLVRIREGEKNKMVLHKFMDPTIAQKILSDELSLHGKDVVATIFFLDFRNFSKTTEEMPADQMVTMLNTYFNEIVEILKKHRGILDKFVGDAVLALWGVPDEDPAGPLDSVRAAIEIQQRIAELNEVRKKENKITLEAAIGIHYAKVTEGIMGSAEFSEFTVIGSAVNIASRICDEAKANEIYITTNVFDMVIGQVTADPIGEHKFEGISHSYSLFKVKV